jgi:NAD(P)-dependent dehydrogenase (short-subunit alcohol dehydrogenase family)
MSVVSEFVGRSAAITGAGSGLGSEIALDLVAKGYIVFGTAASAAEVRELKEASGGRVRLAVCDITKQQAVKAWIDDVSHALGSPLQRIALLLSKLLQFADQRGLSRRFRDNARYEAIHTLLSMSQLNDLRIAKDVSLFLC